MPAKSYTMQSFTFQLDVTVQFSSPSAGPALVRASCHSTTPLTPHPQNQENFWVLHHCVLQWRHSNQEHYTLFFSFLITQRKGLESFTLAALILLFLWRSLIAYSSKTENENFKSSWFECPHYVRKINSIIPNISKTMTMMMMIATQLALTKGRAPLAEFQKITCSQVFKLQALTLNLYSPY